RLPPPHQPRLTAVLPAARPLPPDGRRQGGGERPPQHAVDRPAVVGGSGKQPVTLVSPSQSSETRPSQEGAPPRAGGHLGKSRRAPRTRQEGTPASAGGRPGKKGEGDGQSWRAARPKGGKATARAGGWPGQGE